jgi:hypothetical protein
MASPLYHEERTNVIFRIQKKHHGRWPKPPNNRKTLDDEVVGLALFRSDGAGTKPENTKHQGITKPSEILDLSTVSQ